MNITAGEKSNIALEFVEGDTVGSGNIYLYVNNEKYGHDDFEEELAPFMFRAIKELYASVRYFPDIFKFKQSEIYAFIDCIYDGNYEDECSDFKMYENISDGFSRNGIFRCEYAFDKVTIIFIENNGNERLLVLSDDNKSDIILNKGEFCNLFIELAEKCIPDISWSHINKDTSTLNQINN